MGDDDSQVLTLKHLRCLRCAVRMAEPVETVAPESPFTRPIQRHRVQRGGSGERGMECGVEHGYLQDLRQNLFNCGNGPQACWIVQRCEVHKISDLPFHFRRDSHGRSIGPAMYNAVCDYLYVSETNQSGPGSGLQFLKDASRRILVLFKFEHLPDRF